jgi:hypothetical protein
VAATFAIDLECNRKFIFEKLGWLNESLEDLLERANHNIAVQQEQLRATTARFSTLEKPISSLLKLRNGGRRRAKLRVVGRGNR